jgi:hypothetical protein
MMRMNGKRFCQSLPPEFVVFCRRHTLRNTAYSFTRFDRVSQESVDATDNQFAVLVAGKDIRAEP